ncbi:sigma-54 interaction domain-containing protein [Virgibacillus kekensis]|uniref:Sigma-54 interaction domain-containing protein n=1 Tax=Virgibacillus kekensis TaxID=202261 RepID=A0ABV9DG54_9BACI
MVTVFQGIEHFINPNCLVLEEEKLDESKIASIIKSEYPKKVFLANNGEIYFIKHEKQMESFIYLNCGVINPNEEITEVVSKLEDHEYLIAKDRNEKVMGYVHSGELSKQMFTAYQRVRAYVSTILETIDASCTVIDRDKRVLAWTKGAEQIFSFKQDDIIGKPITDFFSPEHLEILDTLESGSSVYHRQHRARENQVVLINSNPVHFNDEIVGAVVSETDITSQIRLNNELYNATEKLFNLEKEVTKLTATADPFQYIRGSSPALNRTINKIKKASSTNTGILIHGESGVGKELFAKAVHNLREDKDAPFVPINCGAIPSALFESEIFGYEKGAFSGADQKGKKGKVQLAKGGTLFLDEIGEMPLEMQVKILRLLQEKKFFTIGGTKEIEVDFRVIAATNRNLEELVKENKFREDLYYRLNVVSIEIPPLRERPEDIIELTHYFLHEISIKYNRPIHGISQTVMQALLQHEWPGNIRELKNVVERLVVFSENGEIKLEDLPFDFDTSKPNATNTHLPIDNKENSSLSDMLNEVERNIIIKELKKTDGNKMLCAQNLQITRATLYNRIKKLGIK